MVKLNNKLKVMLGTVLVAVSAMGLVLPVGAAPCPAGMSAAECAQGGLGSTNPDPDGPELTEVIKAIINTIIFVVGIVAVIMIILGGIQYSTSQGDPGKVKKAKDTILYGIVGLVVALVAFSIVNFVLTSVF